MTRHLTKAEILDIEDQQVRLLEEAINAVARKRRRQNQRQERSRKMRDEGYICLRAWVRRNELRHRMVLNGFIEEDAEVDREDLQYGFQDIVDDWLE